MKMNKKGFTLIEMLVVIAIIAVLVSIIIPVVGNSTVKAQAAAIAANLRSAKAEISTEILTIGEDDDSPSGHWTYTWDEGKVTAITIASDYTFPSEGTFAATVENNGDIKVTLNGGTIAQYAEIAKNGGDLPTSSTNEDK